jgi:hypothetical protein
MMPQVFADNGYATAMFGKAHNTPEPEISPAGPPFTGTWSSRGKSFRATFWTGTAGDQGPDSVGPTIRVQLRGALSRGTISATYRFTVFAPGSFTQVLDSGGKARQAIADRVTQQLLQTNSLAEAIGSRIQNGRSR